MTKIFIFTHFGLNIHHSFLYSERLCLYNREISLAILLRQNSKTNMTKNRDKIMKYWYIFCHIAHPCLELTGFVTALAQTALKSFSKISFVWKYCQVCKQPLTLKTDTKKRKYCSSLSKLNVHYAKYGREILNIELGVGVYMNVFLRGFEKSLPLYITCIKNKALQLKDQVQLMKIFNHQEGCCQPFRSIGSCVAP